MKIKKGDTVVVTKGKEKGKSGRVLKFFPDTGRVLIQGVNFVKRHTKQARQDKPGGILQKESPLHRSNVALLCPRCNKATRLGAKFLADNSKVRVCKKCQEMV